MKQKGIGRPSTYAITIEKLLERKYVVEKNGYLFATKLGFRVVDIVCCSSICPLWLVPMGVRLDCHNLKNPEYCHTSSTPFLL
jgi:hypothetical protein